VYQAILKTATGNSQFNFEVTTVPYPALDVLKERQAEGNSLEFVFMVGIGISLIPCAMISFILKEKQESLKHMQLISGMSLPAYWISNLVADVLKVYVPIVLIVLLSVAFGSNYPGVWVVFMILPWGLVPFTYLTSFMFTNDTNAQIMTLLLNFVVCVVLAVTVYFLQLIPETFAVGDKLRWYLCIFPNYCVMNALLWSSEGAKILAVRQSDLQLYPQLPEDLFAFKNLGGDVFMLLLHFVVDLGLVALIEVNAFDFIKRKFATVAPAPENSIEFDDDVSKEEERIANDKSEVVRVYKFRKVYQAKALCKKPFLAV
jgi:ATP-binding cassette, subfamily A (ABC1), member 3